MFKGLKRAAAIAIAAVMMLPNAVFAEPATEEELQGILEKQMQKAVDPFEEYLGEKDLQEAMKDGFSFALQLAQGEGAAALTGIPADGTALDLNLQVDKQEKKWLFNAGVDLMDYDLADLSIYADQEMLAISVPQIYSKALAIRSGSLKNQYDNSVLKQFVGQEIPDSFDLDLNFFPDASVVDTLGLGTGFSELTENLEQQIGFEKTEAEGETVYTMTMPTQAIADMYIGFFDTVLDIFTSNGMVGLDDAADSLEELEATFNAMPYMMGDEIKADYHIVDDKLTHITMDLVIDGNYAEQLEDAEQEYDPAQVISLNYDIVFVDPENPLKEIDVNVTGSDEEGNEAVAVKEVLTCDLTETTADMNMALYMDAEDQKLEIPNLFELHFDAESANLTAALNIPAEEDGDQAVSLVLDGTFTDVEKGKAYTFNINEFGVREGEQKIDITGSMRISADCGDMPAPADTVYAFEATEEELSQIVMEIQQGIQNFTQMFGGSVETE